MSQRSVKYLDLEVSFDAENIIIFAELAVYIWTHFMVVSLLANFR
jgi:hypothetical protein